MPQKYFSFTPGFSPYVTKFGPTWLWRWTKSKGMDLDFDADPDPPKWVMELYNRR